MRISFGFSGPAGAGVNTAGLLLSELMAKKGYQVYSDKEYSSVIKGGNNLFIVYASNKSNFISNKIDYYFYFDDFALEKNSPIYDFGLKIKVTKDDCKHQNLYSFGAALKILGISAEDGKELINHKFSGTLSLEQNLIDFDAGYQSIKDSSYELNDLSSPKKIFYGNEILARGAIESGLEYYSAYPMTPASSIIDTVLEHGKNVVFNQGEDEIAVAMSMLGAKFAGRRAMCASSGGGFALMSESISYSGIAEIGGVYILSQRAGPSTGTPTFTGQGDIEYALCPTFGDVYPIVVVPSTFKEAYNLIGKALNWSDIYQHPVIILVDKQFSEGYVAVDESELVSEPINKGKLAESPKEDYARYVESEDGISPYTIPGIANGEFIASSYEHDKYGKDTEDPSVKAAMEEKRHLKLETFIEQEFNDDFSGFSIINPEAKKFFITFSSNRFAVESYLEGKDDFGAIFITVLQPIDERLQEFFDENVEKLIFLEENLSGQFQKLIENNFDLREIEISAGRKYDLYPFFEENLGDLN